MFHLKISHKRCPKKGMEAMTSKFLESKMKKNPENGRMISLTEMKSLNFFKADQINGG